MNTREKLHGSVYADRMCGFTLAFAPLVHPAHDLARARLIQHRGPDGDGRGWSEWPNGHRVSMTAVRLAIVGGPKIQSPFMYKSLLVAFNGEIYNWRELRAQIDGPWTTECDVEVLAHAWYQWGAIKTLQSLRGMFAIAVADYRSQSLVLARDRAGEKPLYYTAHNGAFLAASEIKALDAPLHENLNCLELEHLEFDCTRDTAFESIYSVLPGEMFTLKKGGTDIQHYWDFPWYPDEERDSDPAASKVGWIDRLVPESIQMRAKCDAPLTVLVSGGVDSAIIQKIAKAPVVYTVVPEGAHDESDLAAITADGAELRIVRFTKEEALEDFPKIAWHLDTPATWTAIAQWFLAKQIAKDGFKVVLTGEGSDESFAGYTRYLLLHEIEKIYRHPVLGREYAPLTGHMIGEENQVLSRLFDRGRYQSKEFDLMMQNISGISLVDKARRADWHLTMQVLLRMADRMFMAHGIESRAPFLDHVLTERAFSTPPHHYIRHEHTKYPLRLFADKIGVPKQICWQPVKRGFSVPWTAWMGEARGSRGKWDRAGFAAFARREWRKAFGLPDLDDYSSLGLRENATVA